MAEVPNWVDAGLPARVLAQGYQRTYADGVHPTEMAAGNFRTRLKTIMAPELVQAAIMVDVPGVARFRRFWREDTKRGALPFWLPDQLFHGRAIATAGGVQITTANGSPILIAARWLVMFTPGSPPREGDNQGDWFRINFDLTVLP